MSYISNNQRRYDVEGGAGGDVTVTIPPFATGEIDIDKGDLAANEVKVLPAGGFGISVANQGFQGLVTVGYDGQTIPLIPGQVWTEKFTEVSSTQTTYFLKSITITVSADGEGTYTFRSPA